MSFFFLQLKSSVALAELNLVEIENFISESIMCINFAYIESLQLY